MSSTVASMYDPTSLTTAQRWGLLGASLRDIGSSLNGGDGESGSGAGGGAIAAQQNAIAAAQQASDEQVENSKNADAIFDPNSADPRIKMANFLYKSNPDFRKAAGDAIGKNLQDMQVTAGNTLHNGVTGQDTVAPILRDDNGSQTTQYVDNSVQTGQAAPSFTDQTGRLNATVRTVAPGGTVVSLGQDPNNPQASVIAGDPDPTQLGAAPAGGGVSGGSLGDRSNNPGNIRPPPNGQWQGQIGVNPQGYAIFDTRANGARALDKNLQAYAGHGITTPEALVARWASTSPPNEQAAYAQRIRAAAGSNFDLNDPATRAAIAPAIAASEGTHLGGAPTTAPVAPQPQVASGGARVLYQAPVAPKPQAVDMTPQQVQQAGLPLGTVAQRNADNSISIKYQPDTPKPQALSKEDQKRLEDIDSATDTATNLSRLSSQFMDQNHQVGTGLGAAIPFASMLNPHLSAMNSLTTQMAPYVKGPGMRVTQLEYKQFRGAVPNISNSGQNNAEINSNLAQSAQYMQAKQAFFQDYAQKNGNLVGADRAFNNQQLKATSAKAAAQPKVLTYDPTTGTLQ